MNADITKWSSPAYQEFHKIIKDELAPIFNQVDARVKNFENHFVKEAAKFVRDFKSVAKEADESLDKIIYFCCRNIRSQTELERTKESLQQHATSNPTVASSVGSLKGKSMDTQCASDTLDFMSQKLEDENVSLEFQLRDQLFDKVFEQKVTTKGMSANTKFQKLYSVTPLPKTKVLPKGVLSSPFLYRSRQELVKTRKDKRPVGAIQGRTGSPLVSKSHCIKD
ncbi:hypothetical protein Tco_1412180 [Tanacetum coccineum]